MGMEFELKYFATPAVHQAIREAFPVDYQVYDMQTAYYDTWDRALARRRITLRRRMENGQAMCTVKTPISDYGRGEWECLCGDIGTAIVELCKLGAPQELMELTRSGVEPICGARFRRLAGSVALEDGAVEIALDQGVLTGGGREEPLCEVEVELKAGDPIQATSFAQALAWRFRLVPQTKSKFRRALDLADGGNDGI